MISPISMMTPIMGNAVFIKTTTMLIKIRITVSVLTVSTGWLKTWVMKAQISL